MKTEYSKNFYKYLKFTFLGFCILVGASAQAQVTEEEENEAAQDTIKGYNSGKVELNNPTSITEAYEYDPITDRYIYSHKFEGFNITYPIILTPEEYERLVLKESMRKYYQEKNKALGEKATAEQQKDALPRYYVKSGLFESIFGGNTIDVKPQGSVEVDLGGRYTKQDNPALSPRNRRSFTFDFDQRINMSLQGKVGTRLNVMANYDTQSTFAFQNMIKLDYTPTEDDIIRKIEVGNVSFPLSNSLVRGAQSLFGVKGQFQFGKTTVTGIYSEQKSQTKTVTAQGGSVVQDFSLFALEYDENKHFFLSQFFRNRYDYWLRSYPLIDNRVTISRIEVWVTNKQNRINTTENNSRNIIALQDLGEGTLHSKPIVTGAPTEDITSKTVGLIAGGVDPASFFNVVNNPEVTENDPYPDNGNNKLDPAKIGQPDGLLASSVREIVTTGNSSFTGAISGQVSEGVDYVKLENARKLTTSEYTLNTSLGYISLNTKLNNDEVLAVAFQYTVGDKVYQVGEFGTDGVDATTATTSADTGQTTAVSTNSLVLKMLKSSLVNVTEPTWNLMMKNIYQIPNGYQLSQEDFTMNILYTDPSPLNYITPVSTLDLPDGEGNEASVKDTPLLRVFNMDRLTYAGDPQNNGDGFFDFVQGITVDPQNGRVIFTTVEPFGKLLFDKLGTNTGNAALYDDEVSYNDNQKKYVFRSLYSTTQAEALQQTSKNKFQLKGRFKSNGSSGISLGAFNVPQGSVVVTAGGRTLVEGVDYTVNYQAGTVEILDTSLLNSSTPIEVSLENNNTFGQQTRRFFGVNVEHKFNEKFLVGATLLRMSERPYTTKTNYGQESVNNTIFGMNTNFSTEVPLFTRLVNKLPFVDTDVASNLSFRGEFAYLKPGASKADQFNGEATTYVEDFEGSQSNIDLRAASGWSLSSAPIGYGGEIDNSLSSGFLRGKLAWYSIDPIFYASGSRPTGINAGSVSSNRTRRIYYSELYPNTDIAPGQTRVVTTLDLSYFPRERGPYNFSPDANAEGRFTEARATQNWGGIMRSLTSTNFEQTNVEYIQFWMLDPYVGNLNDAEDVSNTGKIEIHLGEISEDILKDNRKQYENGLPGTDGTALVYSSVWGNVPASQSLIYAFDTESANRELQDVGFDGLNDAEEAAKFPDFAGFDDPAADNYQYYLNVSGEIIDRYKNYNGVQGNSPVSVGDSNRGSSTLPDVEDINKDNTMNTIDAYYKYEVPISPNPVVGQNFIVDMREEQSQPMEEGTTPARWLLYKIPVKSNTGVEGTISSLRSVRFMRMMVTGFKDDITLRMAALDLVRSEWRQYENPLDDDVSNSNDDGTYHTGFDVVTVNVQENASRSPIPYMSPPGVIREQLYSNNAVINQNEQALSLRVYATNGGTDISSGLEPADTRAVFKNVSVDMRQYKKIRMFLHAEALPGDDGNEESGALQDDELAAIVRFGTDATDNFYEIRKPLKKTPFSTGSAQAAWDAEDVWPESNEVLVTMAALTKLKLLALQGSIEVDPVDNVYRMPANELDSSLAEGMVLGIKGNPNFGYVRVLMLGVRNNVRDLASVPTPNPAVRGEVWFNEFRLSDMDNSGGYAATAALDTNFADLATMSATGNLSTIGFGTVEQGPTERSLEDTKQYSLVTNLNVGKLLPKKAHLNIPFNYSVGETTVTPKFDQYYQDITIDQALSVATSDAERDAIVNRNVDYTKTKSINFIGVKKERAPEQKQRIYDPENITLSYSYNQTDHHDYQIEAQQDQQVRATADYNYTFQGKAVEPFKNTGFMKKSQYWKLLSDFNFNYLPSNLSFSSNIIRQYNRMQYRNIDVEGIAISPLYRRNYFFNYQYGFNYNITKSLKFNYAVATSNIVKNYLDSEGNAIENYTVFTDFWNIGTPNTHTQNFVLNYELPLNKLPFLSFLKATYSYNATYNWTRSTDALAYVEQTVDGVTTNYFLGNTIQNNSSHKINANLGMDLFYKYLGIGAKKKPAAKAAPKAPPRPGEKIAATPKVQQDGNAFVNGLLGVLTSVKNVTINYTDNSGTVLPGFLPSLGFLGTTKPTLGFIVGSQDSDVRYEAAKLGYLTNYQSFNQSFTQVNTKDLKLTADVDLFPDFKINLTAGRTSAINNSEQYIVENGEYVPQSPYSYGNFEITTILINTAFGKSDVNGSEAFNKFRENRLVMANRLAEKYYGGAAFGRYGDGQPGTPTGDFADANFGYPVGFGRNNQAVLLPAFLAAYQGKDAGSAETGIFRNVPLPNWTVKYTGLMRYKYFKDRFKRFSIQHGYRASYNINSYRTNYDYTSPSLDESGSPILQDNNGVGNYYNKYVISNVNLAEQFNPLVRFDIEMKNSFKFVAEMKKDRTLNMSFDNSLLTEVKGNDYTLGLGYRIKDVIINSRLANNPTNTIKSDVNLKLDVTLRKSLTIVRYLDYDNNQLGGGQDIWTAKLYADYAFSKNLTAIFYYDHSFSKAVISTTYPVTTIRTGFTIRYTFGN